MWCKLHFVANHLWSDLLCLQQKEVVLDSNEMSVVAHSFLKLMIRDDLLILSWIAKDSFLSASHSTLILRRGTHLSASLIWLHPSSSWCMYLLSCNVISGNNNTILSVLFRSLLFSFCCLSSFIIHSSTTSIEYDFCETCLTAQLLRISFPRRYFLSHCYISDIIGYSG